MSQFMRTDIDFGIPGVIFRIDARTLYGIRLRSDLQSEAKILTDNHTILHAGDGRGDGGGYSNLEKLCKVLEDTIIRFRPELEGLTVIWLEMKLHPPTWEIGVVHPSLPRCKEVGMQYRTERLEKCYVCGEGLSNEFGTKLWMRQIDDPNDGRQCALVCSEECLNR